MITDVGSTFIENVRRSIGVGIRVEIDLLEDEFLSRRVDRWNIRARPFDVGRFVRRTLAEFNGVFFVFLIGIVEGGIIAPEIIVVVIVRSTKRKETNLLFPIRSFWIFTVSVVWFASPRCSMSVRRFVQRRFCVWNYSSHSSNRRRKENEEWKTTMNFLTEDFIRSEKKRIKTKDHWILNNNRAACRDSRERIARADETIQIGARSNLTRLAASRSTGSTGSDRLDIENSSRDDVSTRSDRFRASICRASRNRWGDFSSSITNVRNRSDKRLARRSIAVWASTGVFRCSAVAWPADKRDGFVRGKFVRDLPASTDGIAWWPNADRTSRDWRWKCVWERREDVCKRNREEIVDTNRRNCSWWRFRSDGDCKWKSSLRIDRRTEIDGWASRNAVATFVRRRDRRRFVDVEREFPSPVTPDRNSPLMRRAKWTRPDRSQTVDERAYKHLLLVIVLDGQRSRTVHNRLHLKGKQNDGGKFFFFV